MGKKKFKLINNDSEFEIHPYETPAKYVKLKLDMLQKDMYIDPTEEEVAHLESLTTRGDIDRAVHSIIDRHWE